MECIEYVESSRLGLEGSYVVVKDADLPVKLPGESYEAKSINIFELDSIHREIDNQPHTGVVGLGGFNAVNAAKMLSVRRLKKGGLKQSLFENPSPSRPLVLIPTKPSFCTDVTPLTVVYDPSVPVYNLQYIKPQKVVIPLDLYSAGFEAERSVLSMLNPSLGRASVEEYLEFCRERAPVGLSPEFILALTVSALVGVSLEDALRTVTAPAGAEAARLAMWRKLDHFVEHSWSFYRRFLVYWGIESRSELYDRYSTLFSL
ncbi:iron-containing alcohol dehydrogenase [Infirmifilum lucidum]|uniref:Iron-containing alcohol dehydrogenase n=1 Tax=Infirmifilum lucidum TaxID=2776706 RepID=A0A7L9FKR7_9CREN|nr:iron-containing alcohol dehydrogenase [Infirmifilum lucidum]QOJ79456.1 iron-containing alcohol dehydrogenase [Infirmifilum lucidum]